MATPPTLELVRVANEQGYDAIVLACFSDPRLDMDAYPEQAKARILELAPAVQEAFAKAGPFLLDVPIESDCGALVDESQ